MFSQEKIIQFNQGMSCSEIGQDKILTFKTSSEWVYITFCPICPDYKKQTALKCIRGAR